MAQPEQERVAATRAWWDRVKTDLRSADVDLAATPPILDDALFHAQQAAEKAMKDFLVWHDVPFRKTHDLTEIGRQCLRIDASLGPELQRASLLSEYAWRFRYPMQGPPPDQAEVDQGLRTAREAVAAIAGRLPPEVSA